MLSQRKLSSFRPIAQSTTVLLKLGILFRRQCGRQPFFDLITMARHHAICFGQALIPPDPLDGGQRVLAGRQRINQQRETVTPAHDDLTSVLTRQKLSMAFRRDFYCVLWNIVMDARTEKSVDTIFLFCCKHTYPHQWPTTKNWTFSDLPAPVLPV